MLDIQFKIGGRKLEPCFIGDSIEKQTLLYVARQLRNRYRDIRIPDRGDPLRILVHGEDVEHLHYEIHGPTSVLQDLGDTAGDLTAEEIVLTA